MVYADEYLAVIVKPAGMLSVPGKGPDKQDCAATRIPRMFPKATGPIVVHRLDMETSGLLVYALDAQTQRELSMLFESRQVDKCYVALLDGLLPHDSGEIDLPLRPDIDNRPVQIVDHVHGRPAQTRYTVLARETDRTRVRFVPLTGRTHQLRVHAAIGLRHPIVGDVLYNGSTADRLMLHAAMLAFIHPRTGRRVEFNSAPSF